MKSLYCKGIGYIRKIENDIAKNFSQIFVQYVQNINASIFELFFSQYRSRYIDFGLRYSPH